MALNSAAVAPGGQAIWRVTLRSDVRRVCLPMSALVVLCHKQFCGKVALHIVTVFTHGSVSHGCCRLPRAPGREGAAWALVGSSWPIGCSEPLELPYQPLSAAGPRAA